MKRFVLMLLLSWSWTCLATAQDPDDPQESDFRYRRRAYSEIHIGGLISKFSQVLLHGESEIPGSRKVVETVYFGGGYGFHAPLSALGTLTTLWLNGTGRLMVNSSTFPNRDDHTSSVSADVNLSLYATVTYGGMRRQSAPWGVEGGLGLVAGYRGRNDWYQSIGVVPSAMAAVTWASKKTYQLRIEYDLLPFTFSDAQCQRNATLVFVIGL